MRSSVVAGLYARRPRHRRIRWARCTPISRCRSTATSPDRTRPRGAARPRRRGAARVGLRRPELARDPRPGGRRGQRRLRRHRGERGRDRRGRDGPAHVQRRQRPLGAGPAGARLVGRRPAVPRAGLRAHPPRAGAAADGGRDDLPLRHRRHRVRGRAGARGGGREGRARRRRRHGRRSRRSRRGWSTSCRSTSSPVFLGGGAPLFDGMPADVGLELARVVDSPTVTHLRYRVVKR